MTVIDTETTIVREITIEAPAAKVFDALTDPNQLPQWWGEEGLYRCTKMVANLRVGGAWRTEGYSSDGTTFAVHGVYRTIERPTVLEYTWHYDWDGDKGLSPTSVRFDLEERDGVTHLRLTHSGFTNRESRDGHSTGWDRVLGWLTAYVAR